MAKTYYEQSERITEGKIVRLPMVGDQALQAFEYQSDHESETSDEQISDLVRSVPVLDLA